jgi:hypothetical protein
VIIIAGLVTGAVGLASLMIHGAYKHGYRRAILQNAKRLRSIEVGLLGRYYYPVIHSNEKVFDEIRSRVRSIMTTTEVYWRDSRDDFIRVELIRQSISDQDKLSIWPLDFSSHSLKYDGVPMQKHNECHKSHLKNQEIRDAILHGIIACNILNEYGINTKEYENLLNIAHDSYDDYSNNRPINARARDEETKLDQNEAQKIIDISENQFLKRYYGDKPYTMSTQDYINRYAEEFTSDDKKDNEKKAISAIKCALPIKNQASEAKPTATTTATPQASEAKPTATTTATPQASEAKPTATTTATPQASEAKPTASGTPT